MFSGAFAKTVSEKRMLCMCACGSCVCVLTSISTTVSEKEWCVCVWAGVQMGGGQIAAVGTEFGHNAQYTSIHQPKNNKNILMNVKRQY